MSAPVPALPAYPIKEHLELEGVNVVLLSIPPGANYPQNIFGLSEHGDILWQVEPRSSEGADNRYTSIRGEVGVLVAQTQDRFARKIDAKTGKVLTEERLGPTPGPVSATR